MMTLQGLVSLMASLTTLLDIDTIILMSDNSTNLYTHLVRSATSLILYQIIDAHADLLMALERTNEKVLIYTDHEPCTIPNLCSSKGETYFGEHQTWLLLYPKNWISQKLL
jgi:hypothetical protein